jgi:hypothetical protein
LGEREREWGKDFASFREEDKDKKVATRDTSTTMPNVRSDTPMDRYLQVFNFGLGPIDAFDCNLRLASLQTDTEILCRTKRDVYREGRERDL